MPGEASAQYGCQTFATKKNTQTAKISSSPVKSDLSKSNISVQGIITGNQTWSADTVLVTGNIKIDSSATLSVSAGAQILFTGNYGITVLGRLFAKGTAEHRIEFKLQNSTAFVADTLLTDCWHGISFYNTNTALDSSLLEYCNFEHVKYFENASTMQEYAKYGGAIRLYNFSNLTISNCIIKNNLSNYATAISCFYQSNPQIISNLITGNQAKINAPAIFSAHAYPKIINNTITNNSIIVQIPYSETAAVRNFFAKSLMVNNIIYANQTFDLQLREFKDYYTYNNDIQDLENSTANINLDPQFADNAMYLLSELSPCRNSGVRDIENINWPAFDLSGNNRINETNIDMGANEYYLTSITEQPLPRIDKLTNYPNPFNQTTTITYELGFAGSTKLSVYNSRGELVQTISNKMQPAGKHSVKFDASSLNSGLYIYKLEADGRKLINKMVLCK